MADESHEIARGLRRRDPDLLERLIEQYQHRLFRYLVFFTRSRQLAEDLFQETWLRVLERGAQYDPRFKFEGWLLRVARNLAIDEMRRKNPAAVSEPSRDEEGEEAPFDLPDAGRASAFDVLAAAEERQILDTAMDGLPAYYREALTLRFQEGLPLEEIAQVVSVPLSTVKSRLRRGLQMLSQRLEKLQS